MLMNSTEENTLRLSEAWQSRQLLQLNSSCNLIVLNFFLKFWCNQTINTSRTMSIEAWFRCKINWLLLVSLLSASVSFSAPPLREGVTPSDYVDDSDFEQILEKLGKEAQESIENPDNYVADDDFDKVLQRLSQENSEKAVEISSNGTTESSLEQEQTTTQAQLATTTIVSQVEASSTTPPTTTTTTTEAASSKKPRKGSVTASDRLMKELSKVHKSESHKKGLYTVELVDDNLYEWSIKLSPLMMDSGSRLHRQLISISTPGKDYVELRVSFDDNYPFTPPFVRIAYPYLEGPHLFQGGAICLEILSPQVSLTRNPFFS